jgi:hypothetical protein
VFPSQRWLSEPIPLRVYNSGVWAALFLLQYSLNHCLKEGAVMSLNTNQVFSVPGHPRPLIWFGGCRCGSFSAGAGKPGMAVSCGSLLSRSLTFQTLLSLHPAFFAESASSLLSSHLTAPHTTLVASVEINSASCQRFLRPFPTYHRFLSHSHPIARESFRPIARSDPPNTDSIVRILEPTLNLFDSIFCFFPGRS